VSKILSIAVKMLKRAMPGIRLLASYADLDRGHLGKIYQASNWVFVGETGHETGIVLNGKLTHRRTINSKYGTSDMDWLHEHVDLCARRVEGKPKFKYLFPLDNEIAARVKLLSKPYPKLCATSDTMTRRDSIPERDVRFVPWRSKIKTKPNEHSQVYKKINPRSEEVL